MEGIEITNEEEKFFIRQFAEKSEMEQYLNKLLNDWRFVTIEALEGSKIIVKVISRKAKGLKSV